MSTRQAHNQKARQSTAGSRKKGKRKTKDVSRVTPVAAIDSNADVIVPKTQDEKEHDRKLKLRQEVPLLVLFLSFQTKGR